MKRPLCTTAPMRSRMAGRSGAIGVSVSNSGITLINPTVATLVASVPVLLASITGPLVNLATHLIRTLGLAGVFALTTMTGVVGVPGSEPTMLFAGFNVYEHHLSLPGIIVFGVIGDVFGACIAYAI